MTIYTRGARGAAFVRHRDVASFVSPRMAIRFDPSREQLVVRYPDGRPFISHTELTSQRDAATAERDAAVQRMRRLRDLGRLARSGQATPEQLAELKELEDAINGP